MNSIERFYATISYQPVDRPACWLGDPTPAAAEKLCKFYGVADTKELKRVCGDDFYAVEIPYHSPTCNAIFAAFDWYMNGTNVDTEHRTLTADGCFCNCEDLEDVVSRFLATEEELAVLQIVGHSYDLDVEDKWAQMERIFAVVSGRSDVLPM